MDLFITDDFFYRRIFLPTIVFTEEIFSQRVAIFLFQRLLKTIHFVPYATLLYPLTLPSLPNQVCHRYRIEIVDGP